MCHLILSMCKIFFSLILTLQTGWISITTVYFRLLAHVIANPHCILHLLLMCRCMLCVALPPPFGMFIRISGPSAPCLYLEPLFWADLQDCFPFSIKSFSKGHCCPDTCRKNFSSCAKAVLYFLTFFSFKYSTSQFLASYFLKQSVTWSLLITLLLM